MNAPLNVTLSVMDLSVAAHVGVTRQIEALRAGLPDRHGYEGDGWSAHIEGAAGELALATVLCCRWDFSVNTFRTRPDVAGLEVRTRSKHSYDLIHRPDDDPTKAYVLVTGRAPFLSVRGWAIGAECRMDGWWQEHGGRPGAWFVPADALHPLADLPVLDRGPVLS